MSNKPAAASAWSAITRLLTNRLDSSRIQAASGREQSAFPFPAEVFHDTGPAVNPEHEILFHEAEPGLVLPIQDREIDPLSRSRALRNNGLDEGERDGNDGWSLNSEHNG